MGFPSSGRGLAELPLQPKLNSANGIVADEKPQLLQVGRRCGSLLIVAAGLRSWCCNRTWGVARGAIFNRHRAVPVRLCSTDLSPPHSRGGCVGISLANGRHSLAFARPNSGTAHASESRQLAGGWQAARWAALRGSVSGEIGGAIEGSGECRAEPLRGCEAVFATGESG